jgi:hypothetical protein
VEVTRWRVKHPVKEVLSMRLGKEQAAGFVEDTEADALAVEAITVERADPPLTTEPEPSLTVH